MNQPAYRTLYKLGALAALIAAICFRRNMDAEWSLLRSAGLLQAYPSAAPTTIAAWFELLQAHPLLGLVLLNLFDLVNYTLVAFLFLALYFALRQASPSLTTLGGVLGFAGVVIYLASSQTFTLLSLSRSYAVATGAAQRAALLTAGQAVLAIHQNAGFSNGGLSISFLLVSLAGLLFALAMRHSSIFSPATTWTGILANVTGLGYYLALALAPALVFAPLSISAVFLLAWYLLAGLRLWRLASGNPQAGANLSPMRKESIV